MEINYAGVRHEQLGVTVESTNEIKVSGEYTPAGDDRTVRFNSVYGSIPENFSSSELTVDLTLRIRIPKIISAAQTGPTGSQATTSQEAAQETRDEQKGQKNGEYLKRWLHPEPVSEDVKWELKEEESSIFLLIHLLSELDSLF